MLADVSHLCVASGVGVELNVDALPASDALRERFDGDARRQLQAAGGDDYELCFTAPAAMRVAIETAARNVDVPVTRIGRVVARNVRVVDAAGEDWQPARSGWKHFE